MAQQQHQLMQQQHNSQRTDKPLRGACRRSHTHCCRRLLERGARPANSAIFNCFEGANVSICKMLLRQQAQCSCIDSFGDSPLLRVLQPPDGSAPCDRTAEKFVVTLAEEGDEFAPLPSVSRHRGELLSIAAANGCMRATEAMLAAGAAVDAAGKSGRTALQNAAAADHINSAAIVKALLKAGADAKVRGARGTSIVLTVCENRSIRCADVLRMLLERDAGASNAADCGGVRPLLRICQRSDADVAYISEAIQLLLAAGADPNAAGAFGETPMMAAVAMGNDQAVQQLLQHGVDGTKTLSA